MCHLEVAALSKISNLAKAFKTLRCHLCMEASVSKQLPTGLYFPLTQLTSSEMPQLRRKKHASAAFTES